jgi:hypothetical protein
MTAANWIGLGTVPLGASRHWCLIQAAYELTSPVLRE